MNAVVKTAAAPAVTSFLTLINFPPLGSGAVGIDARRYRPLVSSFLPGR